MSVLDTPIGVNGSHLFDYNESVVQPFDYAIRAVGSESSTVFVPERRLGVHAFMTGEGASMFALRRATQNLLAVNSIASEDERKTSSYLDLAYSKVFSKLETRSLIVMAVNGPQPKFVVATNGVPVYFFVILSDDTIHLLWTNEERFDERVRDELGDSAYVYRMQMYYDGVCVIQSNFLDKRLRHWIKIMADRLKVMNALDRYLHRRWIVRESVSVNVSGETDHLVSSESRSSNKEKT